MFKQVKNTIPDEVLRRYKTSSLITLTLCVLLFFYIKKYIERYIKKEYKNKRE